MLMCVLQVYYVMQEWTEKSAYKQAEVTNTLQEFIKSRYKM